MKGRKVEFQYTDWDVDCEPKTITGVVVSEPYPVIISEDVLASVNGYSNTGVSSITHVLVECDNGLLEVMVAGISTLV